MKIMIGKEINCHTCRKLFPDYLAYNVKLSFERSYKNICHVCNDHNRKKHLFDSKTRKWIIEKKPTIKKKNKTIYSKDDTRKVATEADYRGYFVEYHTPYDYLD